MSQQKNKSIGGLVISEDVIAKIASVAAKDVEGVADIVTKPTDFKNIIKRNIKAKAVTVSSTVDDSMIIDINIRIKLGARIPDVTLAVQQSIRNAVQNMVGKLVAKVNVNIEDIDITDEQER